MTKRSLFLTITSLYFLVTTIGYLLAIIDEHYLLPSNMLYLAAPFITVGAGIYCVIRLGPANEHAKSLAFLVVGLGYWLIGEILFSVYKFGLHIDPFPSAADIFYILGYPLILIGLYREAKKVQFSLTSAHKLLFFVVFLLLGFLTVYFGVYLAYQPEASLTANLVAMSYGLGDLLLIIPTLYIAVTARELRGGKLYYTWLAIFVGLTLVLIADVLFAIFTTQYDTNVPEYNLIDLLWIGSYLFFGYGMFHYGVTIEETQNRLKGLEPTDHFKAIQSLPEMEVPDKARELETILNQLTTQNKKYEAAQQAMLNLLEDQKELEEQLKQEKATVEKKVEARTQELAAANQRLKELDKLKDEFVAIASHELRTPMTAIGGYVDMILEGRYGPVDKKLIEPLTAVQQGTRGLVNLISDMLNISRIEAGRLKFSLTTFKINDLIDEVMALLKPVAETRHITISMKLTRIYQIQADLEKTREILENLLGNSLKFTDKGRIILTAQPNDDRLIILVKDTGIGIAKSEQGRLFGKFQQINAGQGRQGGTGLGLYLSRRLAQKMGGEVWLEESTPKKGSTFAFTLPLADTALAQKVKRDLLTESHSSPDRK